MIKITLTRQFRIAFAERIQDDLKLNEKFWEALDLFTVDPKNPVLKSHPLQGRLKGCSAFSVDYDCRVVYQELEPGIIQLVDIGTHKQVY